jgi:hypothetical protein
MPARDVRADVGHELRQTITVRRDLRTTLPASGDGAVAMMQAAEHR